MTGVIVDELLATPIGWNVDDDGKLWPPSTGHAGHIFDGGCAICRARDRPEALAALVAAILRIVGAHQVLEVHQVIAEGGGAA